MAKKRKGSAAKELSPSPIGERWLGLAERIVVDLAVLVLLVRTLVSSLAGGPGAEQAFVVGVLATLVLGAKSP